jgi:hypothetical protein
MTDAGAASSRLKLAIMQPYLFPYIGYFQLLASVDEFVVYDNIQYTKKGWINRNRFLQNGEDVMFSLPLAKASDYLDIREREIADGYNPAALLARFAGAYGKAPFYAQTRPLLEDVLGNPERNLFAFLHDALLRTAAHLGLETVIRVSSTVPIDHVLAGQDKVLALCEALGATTYINPIGGVELYSRKDFAARGIELHFLQPLPLEYVQFGRPFVPWLSIIDVLMFNELDTVRAWLDSHYELT